MAKKDRKKAPSPPPGEPAAPAPSCAPPAPPASAARPAPTRAKSPALQLPVTPASVIHETTIPPNDPANPVTLHIISVPPAQPQQSIPTLVAPNQPATSAPAGGTPVAKPPTPASGVPVVGPTPIHKSARNLSPMEQMLWTARLKKAKEVVAEQMKVTVTGGKLVRRYTAIDHDEGLFEIETDKGFYVAVLSKTGEFSIYWRHDRKAY